MTPYIYNQEIDLSTLSKNEIISIFKLYKIGEFNKYWIAVFIDKLWVFWIINLKGKVLFKWQKKGSK